MNEEKKEQLQAAAQKVAVGALAKAKLLSGWRKWVAIVIGTLAAGAAAWLMAGCTAAVKQADAGRAVAVHAVKIATVKNAD